VINDDTSVSENGLSKARHQSDRFYPGSRAEEEFKLIDYQNSENIFNFQLSYLFGSTDTKRDLHIEDSEASNYKLKTVNDSELVIIYHIPHNLV